ncbi:hypothetical protein [Iodobacter fluviatilis]|uniref:Uncharacterized protein n=1 Tax=Iodobacter fluviatilis TaxID=537 RepID=A0A377Q3Z7_9NEIS|nr:hypothetical protein [Iodobacter fluviatilis]TCU90635.1 hypothetical protein EV682_101677 [Iodobacter fluviatilis]STQ89663.1 Uncharacterised protein [Iodobacter fluviatilis]
MLTEHNALLSLRPFWVSYQSMLKMVQAGGRFYASPQESYAAKQFEKLYELEHDLSNLKRAADFIRDLAADSAEGYDIYRYHDEHFSMRFAGIVDKSHRLVGASLLLKADKCEGSGGNAFVIRAAKDHYPDAAANLERLTALEANHKKARKAAVAMEAGMRGTDIAFEAIYLDELNSKIAAALAALLLTLKPVYELI